MPQKTRKEKERAAQRRLRGETNTPIVMPLEPRETGLDMNAPVAVENRNLSRMAVEAINKQGEFDYSYVYTDLRRIALLAILCFGIMIALAFILK